MAARIRAILCVLVLATGLAPAAVHAQFNLLQARPLIIIASPARPEPGHTVVLTLESPAIDLSHSVVDWYVNDELVTGGEAALRIAVVAGALGSVTNIRAVVASTEGTLTAQTRIVPAELDLLYDATSYVPPFYEGRALPSPASALRFHALARIIRPGTTTSVPEDQLVYSWYRNGRLLASLSGRGRSNIRIAAPGLFETDTIRVAVTTRDGAIGAERSVSIPSVEPLALIYEDNPLSGILYRNALSTEVDRYDAETTLAAVPFYALATGPTDKRLEYAWTVGGKAVAPDAVRPDEITVGAEGGAGTARIAVSITHATDLSMEAGRELVLRLLRATGPNTGTDNPFRAERK